MGKLVQQLDIDFNMRKYGTLKSLQIYPNLVNAITWKNHLGKPHLNLNTLLQECTTQLYDVTHGDPYDRTTIVWNPYSLAWPPSAAVSH